MSWIDFDLPPEAAGHIDYVFPALGKGICNCTSQRMVMQILPQFETEDALKQHLIGLVPAPGAIRGGEWHVDTNFAD